MKKLDTVTNRLRIWATLAAIFMVTGLFGQTTYYSKAAATDFNNPATWGTNTDGTGTSPGSVSSADNFIIQNASALSLTGNAAVRQLTLTSGSLTVSSNTLTIAITGQNNSTFLVNGGTLNLSGTGSIVLNGNFLMSSGALNQSGGDLTIDGNNGTAGTNGTAGNSVAQATHLFSITGGTINCTAGNITVVDPPFNTYAVQTTRAIHLSTTANNTAFTGTHTFVLGDGTSTAQGNTDGFVIECYSSGRIPVQNVTVNAGNTTGRWGSTSFNSSTAWGTYIKGTLTINSGSEFRVNPNSTSANEWMVGSIVNNGTLRTGRTTGTPVLHIGGHPSLTGYTPSSASSITGSGVFANLLASPTAHFNALVFNNANGISFGAGTLALGSYGGHCSGSLTFTAGVVNTNGQTFINGISTANTGALTVTSGGFSSGSTYGRWWTTAQTGGAITAGAVPGTATSQYPFVVNGLQRSLWIEKNATAATSGGVITVTYTDAAGLATVAYAADGAYTPNRRTNASWVIANPTVTATTYNGGTAQYEVAISGEGLFNSTVNTLRVANAAAYPGGTHQNGTTLPHAQRGAIPAANLFSTMYIAVLNTDAQNIIQSAQTGNWSTGSTWVGGVAPTSADFALINNGHNVTVDGTNAAAAVTVNAGGTLTIAANTLTTGNVSSPNNLANTIRGTLAVSGTGTFNVNGSLLIANGATFSQTGGDINIDGNSGTLATSVPAGTDLFSIGQTSPVFSTGSLTFSGGTLTIVDPHAATTGTAFRFQVSNGSVNATGHTFRFGDGSSTTAGGNATTAFQHGTFYSSSRFAFGNLIINGGFNANRVVTAVYEHAILGDLTINAGGQYNPGVNYHVNGNLTVNGDGTSTLANNGRLVTTSTLFLDNFAGGTTTASPNAQVIGGSGYYINNATIASSTANFNSITIRNSNATGVTFNNANSLTSVVSGLYTNTGTISGTVTFNQGNVNLGANTFIFGTAAATPGSLTYTAGGFVGGTVRRFINLSAITPTTGGAVSTGAFPFITSAGVSRIFQYGQTATVTVGGWVQVTYNDVAGTTPVSITDGVAIGVRSNSNWVVTSGGGLTYGTGTGIFKIRGDGYALTTLTDARIVGASAVANGTSGNGTNTLAAPEGNKTNLTVAQLAGTYYFGTPSIINSVATGNWDNTATWDCACVPNSGSNVIINSTHNVTVSGTNAANALQINSGGTLTGSGSNTLAVTGAIVNSGTINAASGSISAGTTLTNNASSNVNVSGGILNVGTTLTNTGTITVSAGTLNAIAATATLTQNSGSVINISGGTFNFGPAGGHNRVFNLSTGNTLAITGTGTFNVNGNVNMTGATSFTMTGGNFNIDGNSGVLGTSVASGTDLLIVPTNITQTVTGGIITIVDPPFAGSANSFSNSFSVGGINWAGNTLRLGGTSGTNTTTSTTGFILDCYVGTSPGRTLLGTVEVNGGNATPDRFTQITTATSNGVFMNNLIINANSELRQTTATAFFVAGDITNNGTLTVAGTLTLGSLSAGAAAASTLPQTISGSGVFRNAVTGSTASFTNLTINNTNATGITVNVNNLSVGTTLTWTAGRVALGSNNFILGTSAASTGTLTYTAGGFLSGTFTRWFGTGAISIGANTNLFPFLSATNSSRAAWYGTSGATTTGGTVSINYTDGVGTNTVTAFTDAGVAIEKVSNANWQVSQSGLNLGASTAQLRFRGTGITTVSSALTVRATGATALAPGTSVNGSGTSANPEANKTLLATTDFPATFYFGAPNTIQSVASGNWASTSVWDCACIPTSTDNVVINNTHTVQTDALSDVAGTLQINSGGILNASANPLDITTSISNAGTINISGTGAITVGQTGGSNKLFSQAASTGTLAITGGSLTVNGNVAITSGAFNMSAGNFVIDGNGNSSVNSVAAGTRIFEVNGAVTGTVNGGTITIVDPHFDAATTQTFGFTGSTARSWVGNTLQLGNGASTDASASTAGFVIDCLVGSGRLTLGNVIVNGGNATNRWTSSATNTSAATHITNLTINSGSEFRTGSSATCSVAGNLTNNGTMTVANTLSLAGTNAASTLTQTIGGTGVFQNATTGSTASFSSLTINNSNATGITWNINNASISGALTFTAGKVALGASNTFTIGVSTTTLGTVSYTAGGFTSGTVTRWFGTGTISVGTTSTSRFPFTTATGANDRSAFFGTSGATSGGTVSVKYNDAAGASTITSFTDLGADISKRSNASWDVSNAMTLGASTGNLRLTGQGVFTSVSTAADARITAVGGAAVGTSVAGTGSVTVPAGNKTTMSTTDLNGTFYVGIPSLVSSVASGNWSNTATWDCACVPTSADQVTINSAHTVALDGANAAARVTITGILNAASNSLDVVGNVTVNGTLNVSGGTVTIGPAGGGNKQLFVSSLNGGAVNISAGTLNVNGNVLFDFSSFSYYYFDESFFTMSGGNFNIDPNDGTSAGSVAAGTTTFYLGAGTATVTGGTITIVDPPFSGSAYSFIYDSDVFSDHNWAGNTFILGDGVSTHPSTATRGFGLDTYFDADFVQLGNLVVNGGSAASRFASGTQFSADAVYANNITINAGSELRSVAAGGEISFSGNLVNNGTLSILTNSTLSLENPSLYGASTSTQSISGTGIFRNDLTTPTASIGNLVINNNNATGVTLGQSLSVDGTFTFTRGRIDQGSNTFTLGTSATAPGTLTFLTGTGGFINGTITRWFANSGTVSLGNVAGQFPFIETTASQNRMALVGFSGVTNGGSISVTYNDAAGVSSVTPFVDNGSTISKITNANWVVSNTMSLGSSTASLRITGDQVTNAVPVFTEVRATYATSAAPGNSAAGSGTSTAPEGNKNLLTATDLAGTYYIGFPSAIFTIATGNWNDPLTWDCNCVPSSADVATIRNTHTVTLDGANVAASLGIEAGGALIANANSLTLSRNLTNNGSITLAGATITQGPVGGGSGSYSQFTGSSLTVSSGTFNVNGSFNIQGGTFTQSGGLIAIDGNSGSASTSVPSGTALFQIIGGTPSCTAGTIRIVDPPHSGTTVGTSRAVRISIAASTTAFTGTHTFEFGDGVSTTAGNADGFAVETRESGRVPLQNVVVNAGSGTNRFVSGSYTSGNFGFHVTGNLTINAGSEVRRPNIANEFVVGGNITNNGTFTSLGNVTLGAATGWTITNAQTIGGSGVYQNAVSGATANFTSLTFNNTSTTNAIDFSGISNPSASGTLTFTAGLINLGAGNTFTLGTSTTSVGTLAWTDGGFTSGIFRRYYATATVGAGNDAARFPFTVGADNRSIFISFPSVAPTAGGTASVSFNGAPGVTGITTFNDGPLNVDTRFNNAWTVSTSGITTAGNDAQIRIRSANANVPNFNTTTISLINGIAPGVRVASGGSNVSPQANRGTMSVANLNNTFYLAYDAGTCAAPTALAAGSITGSSASISWTSAASQWDIEYGITGYTPDFVPEVTATGSNPYVFPNNLLGQTGYSVYVRSRCGGSTSSWTGPVTFTTLPQNDEICGTLPTLTVNDLATFTTFSNTGATTSTSPAMGSCQTNAGGDVWFRTTVPADGGLAIYFRSSVTSPLSDLVVNAFTSSNNTCSGTLTLVGCNDDGGPSTLPFVFVPSLTPGATVFIRVADYSTLDFGNFDIAVTPYYQWTGTSTTTWTDATNWLNTDNAPAATTDNILIPGSITNYPVSTGNGINALKVLSGGRLTVTNGNSVTVRGNLTATNAQFLSSGGTTGRISMVGSSPQVISGNANQFANLRIDGSGGVTIASGANMQNIIHSVELKGGSLTTNGNITLKSTATTTAYIDNFSSTFGGGFLGGSTITMERFNPGTTGFRYLSMPINNANISEISEVILFGTNNAQLIPLPSCSQNNLAQSSPYGNVMEWREAGPYPVAGCRQSGWYVRSSGTLQNVRGYLVKITAGQTLTVTGQPNMTDQTFATSLDNTNSTGDGWHLMGNPFPSPIQWTGVTGFGDMNLFSTSGLYTGTYASFAPAQNKIIASQQGFFVRRLAPGALPFTLTNAMRRASSNISYQNTGDQWYEHLMEIDVTGNGFADHSTLYFNNGASANYEAYYDARKMEGRDDQPTIYTHLPNGTEQLGVNGLGKLDETYIVPLVMKPGQNGSFTLNFNELATFPNSAMIYLEDLQTGTLTDLRANSSYTFTSDVNDNPERFNIRFEPPVQANVTDQTCETNGSIELVQEGSTVWSSYVVKDNNAVVYAQGNNFSGTVTINNLPAQEYVVTLNHPTGYTTEEYVTVGGGATAVNVTMAASATNVLPNEAVSFTANATNANTFNWNFGDGETMQAAGANVSHTYANAGIYTVTVTAIGDNCQDTDAKSVSVGTTDIKNTNATDLKVYGFGNRVTVEFNNWGAEEANIRMFNMLGQQIQSFTGVSTLKGRQIFDVAGIKPGYYLIQIVSGDKTATRKLFLDGSGK